MVIMASGIARGRVRKTTTTESRNMAAILQKQVDRETCSLLCTSLVLDMTPIKTRYPLTSIT